MRLLGSGRAGRRRGERTGDAALRAAHVADGSLALPPRPDAIALAERSKRRATREGAGARAVELHALAARVLERTWRIEGREQDAQGSDRHVPVGRGPRGDLRPGACDAALAGALLAGDSAHDAATSYAELYRAERRMSGARAALADAAAGGAIGPCLASIEARLTALAAFRPPQRVIEAIDQGLAGEGALAAPHDAGARVSALPQIVRIDEWPGLDSARVVVTLDRAARFRSVDDPAARPPRTFLELDGVDVGSAPRDTKMGGIVTRVRAEATTTGARVSMDLSGPKAYRRVFQLLEPYRVVIDVAKNPPGKEAPRRSRARSVARRARSGPRRAIPARSGRPG